MNKILELIFTLLIISNPSWAARPETVSRIDFKVESKIGFTETSKISITPQHLSFDRQKIKKEFSPVSALALSDLKSPDQKPKTPCYSGSYTKTIHTTKTTETYRGCLESADYAKNARAISLLKRISYRSYLEDHPPKKKK